MAEETPDILDSVAQNYTKTREFKLAKALGLRHPDSLTKSMRLEAAAAVSAYLRGGSLDEKAQSIVDNLLVDDVGNPLSPTMLLTLYADESGEPLQALLDATNKVMGKVGDNPPTDPKTKDPADAAPKGKTPAVSPESTPLQGSDNYYESLLQPPRTMIGSEEEAYAKATALPKEPDQSPAERSYFFGYGGAGAKGPELAQKDQDILGQDSYILGQSSGLTFRGPTEQPAAPFKERSGAARRARIRQGQFSIAEPKREFLRGQARAVRGATEIATQEIMAKENRRRREKGLPELSSEDMRTIGQEKLGSQGRTYFEKLRAERDMRMQNLVNPDRPQFKAEDITQVYDNGRATGTFAPDVDSRDQRIFREQRTAPMVVPQADPNKPDKEVGKIMFDKNRNVVGYSGSRDQAREAAKSNPALADFLKAAKPMSREERQQSERADELARTGQIPESANVDKGYFPPQEKPTTTPATNMAEPKKKKARGRFGAGR